jgi:hypothetical protein
VPEIGVKPKASRSFGLDLASVTANFHADQDGIIYKNAAYPQASSLPKEESLMGF